MNDFSITPSWAHLLDSAPEDGDYLITHQSEIDAANQMAIDAGADPSGKTPYLRVTNGMPQLVFRSAK